MAIMASLQRHQQPQRDVVGDQLASKVDGDPADRSR
jgi:hypothetical protein